jgi:hypothetical protein
VVGRPRKPDLAAVAGEGQNGLNGRGVGDGGQPTRYARVEQGRYQ